MSGSTLDPLELLKQIRANRAGGAETALASPGKTLASTGQTSASTGYSEKQDISTTYDNFSHFSHFSQGNARDRKSSAEIGHIQKNRKNHNIYSNFKHLAKDGSSQIEANRGAPVPGRDGRVAKVAKVAKVRPAIGETLFVSGTCGAAAEDRGVAKVRLKQSLVAAKVGTVLQPVEQGSNPPLSIGPEHVRAGVGRELRLLAEKGRTGEQAMRDAIAITRAKIRNSPALAQDQPKTTRCLICGGREDGDNPFLPFLSGAPNCPNWLHFGCHGEHVRQQSAKVDALMTAAGYGPEAEGAAA